MYSVFAVLLAIAALLAELLCGALGATPPFLAITVFYRSRTQSVSAAVTAALFWGTVQDLVLGRDFLYTPFKLLTILLLLQLIHSKPYRQLPEAMIPGAVLGIMTTFANGFCSLIGTGYYAEHPVLFSSLFFNGILAAAWTPAQIFFCDLLAQKMKFPVFFQPEKNHAGNRQRKVSSRSIILEKEKS